MDSTEVERILRVKDVISRVCLSRSSVYAKAKDEADDFPAAVRLSERVCGWYESEVQAWIKGSRVARPHETAQNTAQILCAMS